MTHRFALAASLAAALVTLVAAVAFGHASLQSSDPADGATITTPYTLTATFDDELTPVGSSIVVQAANGTTVASGTVSTTDPKVQTVQLPVLPEGTYTVLWTSITADDNGLTRGTYHFTVGTTAGAAPTPSPTSVAAQPSNDSTNPGVIVAVVVAVVISVAVLAFVLRRRR
jgi:methionine-rich copper-binding protein CopC